jgi:hypothetical protein
MGMSILIAIGVALLLLAVLIGVLKLAFNLLVIMVVVGFAIMAYGLAQKYIGKGR